MLSGRAPWCVISITTKRDDGNGNEDREQNAGDINRCQAPHNRNDVTDRRTVMSAINAGGHGRPS